METIFVIAVIGIGLCCFMNVYALFLANRYGIEAMIRMKHYHKAFDERLQYLSKTLVDESKKTRKEAQEIKSRLTRVRKDLNNIEKLLKKGTASYSIKKK